MHNRRARKRTAVLSGARILVDGKEHEALVHDLSESGCRLTLPRALERGTLVPMTIGLSESEEHLKVLSKVLWAEPITLSGSFEAGVCFVEFAKPQQFQQLSLILERERGSSESLVSGQASFAESNSFSTISPLEVKRIGYLADLSRHLNRSHEVSEVAEIAVTSLATAMRAERVMLMLDHGGLEPEVIAFRGFTPEIGPDGTTYVFPYSRSIVRSVLAEGNAVISFDVANDERLNAASSLDVLGTRSILCIPLIGQGVVFGLIYMDNLMEESAFSEGDKDVAVVLCELTASAIERGRYFSNLVQVEKMSALGTLTASLAHELNNPLMVMSGISELLREEAVDQKLVDELATAAERCQGLVRDITNWSRVENSSPQEISPLEIIETTIPFVRARMSHMGVRLHLDIEENLPPIKGNVRQFSQVLINLISNSLQALKGTTGGVITLSACVTENELYLSVKDNGPGIAPYNLVRIFDPFFTTKKKGEGTGLGLSISRDIVNRYRGTLEARNLPTGGAVFQIRLPVVREGVCGGAVTSG